MSKTRNSILSRLHLFQSDLGKNEKLGLVFNKLYEENEGNWEQIRRKLTPENGFSDKDIVQKIEFTQQLAEWSGDQDKLVTLFQKDSQTASMRDIALNYDTAKLRSLVETSKIALPEDTSADAYALKLNQELYRIVPSASLQRMISAAGESPVNNAVLRSSIGTFLNNQPDFNIHTTSVYEAIKQKDAFKGIEDQQEEVIASLKTLQRVAAISPVPEAVPVLMKANVQTAMHVSDLPEEQFVKAFSGKLGEDGKNIAKQIHQNAVNTRIRNEQALVAFREAGKSTGIAMLDKSMQMNKNMQTENGVQADNSMQLGKSLKTEGSFAEYQYIAPKQAVDMALQKNNLSWDTLFADADFCECEECTSVYSAAAYYVDLLQYLRNNNLDINPDDPSLAIKTDPKDISGTPLEKLFARRPDLGCLELTCKNTNTILPYVDLVNEVMENYVVFHTTKPVFNVADETSTELLAQPQHINYDAYCILHKAVYPFTLPYHQPVDAIRIFLAQLGTSRHELISQYRSARKKPAQPESPEDKLLLDNFHQEYLNRAYDAEFLNLTQEEYVILTKNGFVTKAHWDKRCNKDHTLEEYQEEIGLKPVYEYYGYGNKTELLNEDESTQQGLSFVKKQFLKRTGVKYSDLVELLKTQYLNPNVPQGKALAMMLTIRFSYRYLQSLVNYSAGSPKEKFQKLIEFLKTSELFFPLIDKLISTDPCRVVTEDTCANLKELEQWVYCHFERIGKMIVLEDGCHCMNGSLKTKFEKGIKVKDCKIYFGGYDLSVTTGEDVPVADIDCKTGKITTTLPDGDSFIDALNGATLMYNNKLIGIVMAGTIIRTDYTETCDISKTRLVHLDGSALEEEEYDRFQRFIRLWNKLGWTINETDQAIIGLSAADKNGNCNEGMPAGGCSDCGSLTDDCDCDHGEEDGGCKDPMAFVKSMADINPELIHQLVALKKLLDKTGIELIKLLSFWTNISAAGEKSLYSRLFLTHNLVAIDKVFLADHNGNYLLADVKLSEHFPVLMAGLNLKTEDIEGLMAYAGLEDKLSLENVSLLHRYRLLAKYTGLRIINFIQVLPVFGDVFKNAYTTLDFILQWERLSDAGFSYQELNYVVKNTDDAAKPLAPSKKIVLSLAKTLYDGLNAIDAANKDIKPGEATSEFTRSKAALIYPQEMIDKIMGILEGSTLYTTNAPKSLVFELAEEKSLKKKLKYNAQQGAIEITGILTPAEKTDFIALSNDPKWAEALDRIGKQQRKLFKELLSGVFAIAEADLLSGDIIIPLEGMDEATLEDDPNTGPEKRARFMEIFLPFLRKELTRRFIAETLSGMTGLSGENTDLLIHTILQTGTPAESLYSIFESVKESATSGPLGWKGYLIPAAGADYTFIVKNSDTKPLLAIDGKTIDLAAQEDPTNEWWSVSTMNLQAGKLYSLEANGLSSDLKDLFWKSNVSLPVNISASSLLPDYAEGKTGDAFTLLKKVAIWVSKFNLTATEISWIASHAADFDGIDFNGIGLTQLLRMEAYSRFRDSIPETSISLTDFFKWAAEPGEVTVLSAKIEALTGWKASDADQLLADNHFNLQDPAYFRNEQNLLRLQSALETAGKIGMGISLLFEWAKPSSHFYKCHDIAESIRKAIRSQYQQEDWEQVVKPLNDKLRGNQQNALIAYLLVQKPVQTWGVSDADGLFEFFLIDVQMCACMETSRIKQAISSVQLFVQRCQLGLEEPYGIKPEVLDRKRWEWMQRYRVWEANRKVFLYPENWIESNLRDDKSPFFKELESELLQKDISRQNVEEALKSYLFKVDEVANMEITGLYIDGEKASGGWSQGSKLHVFSRTRNSPYFFYYRYYALDESNWYAWQKMQVDVPCYDIEDANTQKVTGNGCYLTPVVWNNRLLIFFPQMIKKTRPNPSNSSDTIEAQSGKKASDLLPVEFREIKLGWSELRNGKWTAKQLSKEALYHENTSAPFTLPDIKLYEFFPVISGTTQLSVRVFYNGAELADKGFSFETGGSLIKLSSSPAGDNAVTVNNFHHNNQQIKSLQTNSAETGNLYFDSNPAKFRNSVNFYHPYAHDLIGKVNAGNLEDFFSYNLKISETDEAFGAFDQDNASATPDIFHELKAPYSLYNWELFFHVPMMIADALKTADQFEEAMKYYHYIFSPMASGADDKRFWQFKPFKLVDSEHMLDKIFNQLSPNKANAEINEWRNNPFKPHMVARSRPVAYMKWTVMKYLDNLVAWGDYLFRQDTIESINQATQLYILASHVLGPQPQFIPKRGKTKPQTYLSMLGKWDAFSNAVTELELAMPNSSQVNTPVVLSPAADNGVIAFANIFGFASSLYFCIPNNPKLLGYWDTLADRLYKIRHCENIEGVFRKLPLFEPPIDPALLVKAAAQGLSIASVINDLNTPMPNYRFYYLLQKALEICGELKSLGNGILAALEKKDNESLALLRARHESSMLNLMMEVKKQQLDEAQKSIESLYQNRKAPEHRMRYYLKLIGEDVNKVPGMDSEFAELANMIDQPVDESGLKISKFEQEDMDEATKAQNLQDVIGKVESLASVFHAIPSLGGYVTPIGVGATATWGGSNLGSMTQGIARWMQTDAAEHTFASSSASKKGIFQRAIQERVMQANAAGYEIKQLDKQITVQQIRIDIANQELVNQQKTIDNAAEIEEFLKSKYSNEELYTWMKGNLKTLYKQVYNLTYEIAKKAEKIYRFERGITVSDFIQPGYWDASRDGMMAGEQLYLGLKQLESAYQAERGYDYEITKHISVRELNPLAVLALKETGKCEFNLGEALFDMDFAGHYKRRIKSVSLSIPCVAGPYAGLNATLRLTEHKYRSVAIAKDAGDYAEKTDSTDERFNTFLIPVNAIAVSSGQNDSGVFDLNFKDERYLPFEGAGAISKWSLELPSIRQFDYNSISDIVLHVHYTACEGGERLKKAATGSVKALLKSIEGLGKEEGYFAVIDLKHDLASEWHKAIQLKTDTNEITLALNKVADFLPYYTLIKEDGTLRDRKNITAADVTIAIATAANPAVAILQNETSFDFTPAKPIGSLKTFSSQTDAAKFDNWSLKIGNADKEIDRIWLLVRFTLKD